MMHIDSLTIGEAIVDPVTGEHCTVAATYSPSHIIVRTPAGDGWLVTQDALSGGWSGRPWLRPDDAAAAADAAAAKLAAETAEAIARMDADPSRYPPGDVSIGDTVAVVADGRILTGYLEDIVGDRGRYESQTSRGWAPLASMRLYVGYVPVSRTDLRVQTADAHERWLGREG